MTETIDLLKTALSDRYSIESELGSGGMATVYLAHDIKHDRKVAVKVLRPELAAVIGAERFLHEIKVTANLQHPHILPLHDSGEADSFLYYVMPYVEGESLRDKLNHEKQLSIEETLEITKAVASALDYAHRHEVIHRDIKPENILLQDGQPVVSDFGIALAVTAAGGSRLTETGLSLGTPQYMSPEQAMGDREVDARSDVYALACVTYEMLVGEPPYTGPTAQAVLAKVITEKPQRITVHRDTVPPHVDAAVQKALAKLPADRFATAVEFTDALTRPGMVFTTEHEQPGAAIQGRISVDRRIAVASVVVVLVIGAALGRMMPPASSADRFVTRVAMTPRPAAEVSTGPAMAVSPNGRQIVYSGNELSIDRFVTYAGYAGQKLYLLALEELEATAIPGTEGAYTPFFSPDGEWVGFIADGNLMRVPVAGGAPVLVAKVSAADVRGASWGSNDVIVFAPAGSSGLMRVPAGGGDPEPIVAAREDGSTPALRWPEMLPGGDAVLVTIFDGALEDAEIGVLSLEDGQVKSLLPGTRPVYAQGHVVFARQGGSLLAAPFDLDRHEVTGIPVPIEEGLLVYFGGAAQYALSQAGTLAYRTVHAFDRSLILVNRTGAAELLTTEFRNYSNLGAPRFSPDGMRVAVSVIDESGVDVWVYDRQQSTLSRLTDRGQNIFPSWTPDGSRVAFSSNRLGSQDLYWRPWDASAPAEPLLTDTLEQWTSSWSVSGPSLFFDELHVATGSDISVLSVNGDRTPERWLATEHNEIVPAVSPDGHWIAYMSDESGQFEIYVQSYPAAGGRATVSRAGGASPRWARDGTELFYNNGDSLMVARVATDSAFRVVRRELLFRADFVKTGFDVHPGGNSFVMTRDEEPERKEMVIVLNWFEELRRRMAELGGDSR